MTPRTKRILLWAPRVLGLLLVALLCLDALQVLWAGEGFWRTVQLLLLQLTPGAAVAAVLALSWRRPWVGGAVFTGLAVLYLIPNRELFPAPIYLVVGGTLLLLGVLFALDWRYRREVRA